MNPPAFLTVTSVTLPPRYLVMELLSHGSLIHVLHKKAKELASVQKTVMAGQICDGMVALAASNIVHAGRSI